MPAKSIARSFSGRPGSRAHAGAGDRSPCPLVRTAYSTTNGAARVHEGKHHRGQGPLQPQVPAISVGTGGDGATHGPE